MTIVRFCLIGDTVYVIGGSTSTKNANGKWKLANQAKTLKSKKGGGWVNSANISEARYNHACAVHDGKIFAIGGGGSLLHHSDGGISIGLLLNSVEVFDPTTESWTFGDELPIALAQAHAISWDGHLWVIGGVKGWNINGTLMQQYSNDVYRLEENGWKVYSSHIELQNQNYIAPIQIVNEDLTNC